MYICDFKHNFNSNTEKHPKPYQYHLVMDDIFTFNYHFVYSKQAEKHVGDF